MCSQTCRLFWIVGSRIWRSKNFWKSASTKKASNGNLKMEITYQSWIYFKALWKLKSMLLYLDPSSLFSYKDLKFQKNPKHSLQFNYAFSWYKFGCNFYKIYLQATGLQINSTSVFWFEEQWMIVCIVYLPLNSYIHIFVKNAADF